MNAYEPDNGLGFVGGDVMGGEAEPQDYVADEGEDIDGAQ